ncbi:hypothetical protein M9H77_06506 [Catharanthus roseus]|uniref:Uncharacterized protein n=1 Tax=Catharanthus roseus TaxID=4058 RepID=A0ACC0BS95_CATRO|nr:hypothetical protein M9H77_06506 [Catharanthus roseus]
MAHKGKRVMESACVPPKKRSRSALEKCDGDILLSSSQDIDGLCPKKHNTYNSILEILDSDEDLGGELEKDIAEDVEEDLEEDRIEIPVEGPNEVHKKSFRGKILEDDAMRTILSTLMPQEILLDYHVLPHMVPRTIYKHRTFRLEETESRFEHLQLQSNYYQHCIALVEARATHAESEVERLRWALTYQKRIVETNCYRCCAVSGRVEEDYADIIDGLTKLVRFINGGVTRSAGPFASRG